MDNYSPFLKRGTFTRKKYDRILIATTLAWFVSFIDSCADTLLAGILLNETAVSAVALVTPLTSVISFLACLISVGTSAIFSRESGAFHREEACQCVGQGFICSAIISALMVVAMLLMREQYLAYYHASEEIVAFAREYYTCEIIFAMIFPFYFIIYQLVAIEGDEVCNFFASLVGAVVNIVASYFFAGIYGIKGLAIGSIIATVLAALTYSIHFLRKTNSVHVRLHFNIHDVWEVIKIGSATSMTLLYVAVVDIIMNKFVIAKFGDIYLPAYAVVNLTLNLGAVFSSLYDSCSGFIGVAHGERNPESIRQTMRISRRGIIIISLSVMILMEFAAPSMADLFGITDPYVREAATFAAKIIPLTYPVLAAYTLFTSYYSLTGHVRISHLLSSIYMLISPLVLAIPMGLLIGFNGMSFGFMLTSVAAVSVTMLHVRIRYGKKAVPLILDETDEEAIFHELILTDENISFLCNEVNRELTERNIKGSIKNEVQLILEESYITIMEYNKGRTVLTECNLLISDKSLRLITRDNGKIFDITDSNARVKDFRSYVLALLMERNAGRSNTTTVSFNRNSYIWEL